MIFPGTDHSVVQRTQVYNYEHFGEQPLQLHAYYTIPSFLVVIFTMLVGAMFVLLSQFSCGRHLLTTYPERLTFGEVSKEGPSRQQIEETEFELLFKAKGWSDSNGESEPTKEFNKTMTVMVSGPDPGYMATSSCLIQSGLTILKERDQMPM